MSQYESPTFHQERRFDAFDFIASNDGIVRIDKVWLQDHYDQVQQGRVNARVSGPGSVAAYPGEFQWFTGSFFAAVFLTGVGVWMFPWTSIPVSLLGGSRRPDPIRWDAE